VVVEVKCSLDMSLFYRKTRGLVNRSVHKTPTFIIEPKRTLQPEWCRVQNFFNWSY
jgi:hypothetical protein